ncbi:hypothetical protein HCB45_13030 [Listeria sp. FSL L7-0091]|uniref:hypothetical protein n=1 Tax=Listeria farberi TaxID=2713500 RepID=UPI001623493B|nr:hypothetical protein [Listeria farberi]MBC2262505.1 hypothetical protein [Listeria farberi]
MIKKLLLVFLLVFVFSIVVPSGTSAFGSYLRLGNNWNARFDPPHEAKGKYHIHIYERKTQKGATNMDGTNHGGRNLAKIPKKVQKRLKNSTKYKKHAKKSIKFERKKRRLMLSK